MVQRRIRIKTKGKDLLIVILATLVLLETLIILFLLPTLPKRKITPSLKKKTTAVEKTGVKKNLYSQQKLKQMVLAPPIKNMPIAERQKPSKLRPKISIVIDDWGYNISHLNLLEEINIPLTISVLPFLEYSTEVATFGYKHGFEIIIHMPMQPKKEDVENWEKSTLTTAMKEKEVVSILNKAFSEIPYAKGMNNHMGSLATTDQNLMMIVFKELKKKNMFFLDSYVNPDSICQAIAKKVGIKFAKRSIFLDNILSPTYIRAQLMELAKKADEEGQAIGIGHDRQMTLLVLKEVVPQLQQAGYDFVFVSEIVR